MKNILECFRLTVGLKFMFSYGAFLQRKIKIKWLFWQLKSCNSEIYQRLSFLEYYTQDAELKRIKQLIITF